MGITVYGTIDMGGGYETHATQVQQGLQQRRFGTDRQDQRQRALAIGAQRPQPVQHRHQDQGAGRAELVRHRRREHRLRSLFAAPRQRPAVAGRQQRHRRPAPARPPTATSSRAGQWDNTRAYAGLSNNDVRHADRRPPVRLQQRHGEQLRPVRRLVRLLADRHLGHAGRRPRRHRDWRATTPRSSTR